MKPVGLGEFRGIPIHGFKVRAYLDMSNETRRLMWTLAHAHGTLLAMLNIVFGVCVRVLPDMRAADDRLTSSCLVGATVLLPAGFFLGGLGVNGGDPGLAVLVLPIGAALLLVAVFSIARGVRSGPQTSVPPVTSGERRGKR